MDNHVKLNRADIAKLANVSVAAVSYALSGNRNKQISAETQERICRIARERGYIPNFAARVLSTGKSYNIGFACLAAEWLLDPMFQYVQYGLVSSINQTNYNITSFYNLNDKFFQKLRESRLDGLIIFSNHLTPEISRALELQLPTVLIDLDSPETAPAGDIAGVSSDYAGVIRQVFQEFAARNCRTVIGLIPLSEACKPNDIMAESFLHEAGHGADYNLQATMLNPMVSEFERSEGEYTNAIDRILNSKIKFDGIYLDVFADFGTLFVERARECGLQPERDYHLVMTDTAVKKYPGSVLFVQDSERLGRTAWQVMTELLEGDCPCRNIKVPFRKISE